MKIGIIGGSGLDNPEFLQDYKELDIETEHGKPSSKITSGKINETEVFILSRHGKNHQITPTHVNNRANISALKKLGCSHIIATTAVGSLKEEIKPGHLVILDQLIDFTKFRKNTFYENFEKQINHTSLADPFSEELRNSLIQNCEKLNFDYHKKGTVITIEGPRFSTRAESNLFRQWNADVINMSTAPEAALAKEANIEYSAIAMSTDYDCWKINEKPVSWEQVKKTMQENSEKVKQLILETIKSFSQPDKKINEIENIRKSIRTIPDFPKKGIQFRDITTLLANPEAMKQTLEIFYEKYKNSNIEVITGIESRGFIFGSLLAEKLNTGFVPIRKPGKLPGKTISQEYKLEYGTDKIEMHKDAIKPNQKILIIDDLLATGGTAQAACKLIKKLQGNIIDCAFVVELPDLKGRQKLENAFSIIQFEGE